MFMCGKHFSLLVRKAVRLPVVGLFTLFLAFFAPVNGQSKESQAISIQKISTKVYGVKPFKVKALASSKLPVSILVSGPAEVDQSGILKVKGVGIVRLIAIQNGNKQFNPAKPILSTFEVTKAELTVIAEDKTINKGDKTPELTIDYRGFVNGDSVKSLKKPAIAKIMETGKGIFKKTRIVPSGAESPNYTFKYLTGVLRVKAKKD